MTQKHAVTLSELRILHTNLKGNYFDKMGSADGPHVHGKPYTMKEGAGYALVERYRDGARVIVIKGGAHEVYAKTLTLAGAHDIAAAL